MKGGKCNPPQSDLLRGAASAGSWKVQGWMSPACSTPRTPLLSPQNYGTWSQYLLKLGSPVAKAGSAG